MDDHFLRLSKDALDESKAGERLILCRKAAEAFCKAIAKDGLPEKVEGNLGRMIQHLYARKLIESNHQVSLEIIRMWANYQSHDNPPHELALPQSLDNLRKLREWYRLNYNEKIKENGQTKIKESDPVEVRFKYYYEAHQNLKSEWFDGKKRYRLFGLSDEALVQEWREFLICYVVTLNELQQKIEKEKDSREKITLLLSLNERHLCEISSLLWDEDILADNLKSQIISNLLSLFDREGLNFRTQFKTSKAEKFLDFFRTIEEFSCATENFKNGKVLLEVTGDFNEIEKYDVHALCESIQQLLSPEMFVLCAQPELCDQLATRIIDSYFECDSHHPNDWPVVLPSGTADLSIYNEIVEEIFLFEGENLILYLPSEIWKLMIMAREASIIGIKKHVILDTHLLSLSSLNSDTMETIIWQQVLAPIKAFGSRIVVLSESALPEFFRLEVEHGLYHWEKDRLSAEEYFETVAKIEDFVNFVEDIIVINLPSNLSMSVTRILLDEIQLGIRKNSKSQALKIFVRSTNVPEKLDLEVHEFLNLLNIFLKCFSPYPFLRACIVRNIKECKRCPPWIYTSSFAEAINQVEKIDQPAWIDVQEQNTRLLLTKKGLLTKIDSSKGLLKKYENPGEILLLEDSGWESLLFYFCENGRLYGELILSIPWYPSYINSLDLLFLQKEEKIVCALKIKDFSQQNSIVLCTANGVVKKTRLTAYENFRKGGVIGVYVDEGDSVRDAVMIKPDNHILILTKYGKGLRFSSDQLRDQGRVTRGVRGIRLKHGDEVLSMLGVDDSKLLLIIGENGLAIRTRFSAFLPNGGKVHEDVDDVTPRKRGGQGVTAMNTSSICAALTVDPEGEILIVTDKGKTTICPVDNVRETNRGSLGVKIVDLDTGDTVKSAFLVS